jgi:hypothetical protein
VVLVNLLSCVFHRARRLTICNLMLDKVALFAAAAAAAAAKSLPFHHLAIRDHLETGSHAPVTVCNSSESGGHFGSK